MENIAVDVHYFMRNRAYDIVEVVEAYPDVLGLSIDEDTAAVMVGDEVEVVGSGWVAVSSQQQLSRTPASLVTVVW